MSEPRSGVPAPRGRADRASHPCPGECGHSIPNDFYACECCWRSLPGQLQQAIRANIGQPVLSPARTRAFTAAAEFFTLVSTEAEV